MAISVAHFIMVSKIERAKLEHAKQEQRIIMQQRADKRALELDYVQRVVHRKKDSNILEYIFAFQGFLVGAFVTAMYYA